jgi:hypothetical protein
MAKELIDLNDLETCPQCNSNWHGGSIHAEFMKQRDAGMEWCAGKTDDELWEVTKEHYSPPYTFKRQIAIEFDKDRVEYWMCPDCFAMFSRGGDFILKGDSIPDAQKKLSDYHLKINNNDNQSN